MGGGEDYGRREKEERGERESVAECERAGTPERRLDYFEVGVGAIVSVGLLKQKWKCAGGRFIAGSGGREEASSCRGRREGEEGEGSF